MIRTIENITFFLLSFNMVLLISFENKKEIPNTNKKEYMSLGKIININNSDQEPGPLISARELIRTCSLISRANGTFITAKNRKQLTASHNIESSTKENLFIS